MGDNKITRLYQPNLTCAFDLTKNDEGYVWTLVIRNHDKAGICQEQFIEQLWDFSNAFTKRLLEQKMWDLKEGQAIPPVNVLITNCSRYILHNVIVASENGEQLTPSMVVLCIAELAKNLATEHGVNLQGLKNEPKASYATRN